MDIPLYVFIPHVVLTVSATVSTLLFLAVIHSTCFPLHVRISIGGAIFGSGMLSFSHLGLVITEFCRRKNILYGEDTVTWSNNWGNFIHGYGLSLHTICFFILSLDRLILVIYPSLLHIFNKFSRIIAFSIISYCVAHSYLFVYLLYFSSVGFSLTSTTMCINLLIIPISCTGYVCSRTVAVLKLNVRYELATIRELTRVLFPIATFDAVFSTIAFASPMLMRYGVITALTHNRIYRNTLSVESLITVWLFLLRHRHFRVRLFRLFSCFRCVKPASRSGKIFTVDKSDTIVTMEAAWKMRTAKT